MMAFIRPRLRKPLGIALAGTVFAAAWALRGGHAWQLSVAGRTPYVLTLADLDELAQAEAQLPVTCVEGWSVGADWRGIPLLEVVRLAGGDASSRVRVVSLEQGLYGNSVVVGPQVSAALLATHLNGERLNLDHGYPLRLISPNRPGVLNTKWLSSVEVT